jgi:hypothetical protein
MKKIKYRDFLFNILTVGTAMVMFCWLAFYNRYPLIFNGDTAMYIEAARSGIVGNDRPILYGLFMIFGDWKHSAWLVISIQSLIVSVLFFCYFKYFAPRYLVNTLKLRVAYLLFIMLISFGMNASFTVCWLISDIFTPITILSIGLLLLAARMTYLDKIVISLIAIVGTGMHNSNFFIAIGILLVLIIIPISKRVRRIYNEIGLNKGRFAYLIILLIVSNLLVRSIHYQYHGGFQSSRGGVFFFMGSLVEMGVIDTYLGENCGIKNYRICKMKDTIPNNFVWDMRSPFQRTGGWYSKANESEYTIIIKDIISTPRYAKTVFVKSFLNTLKQFFYYDTGEAYRPWDRVNSAMYDAFPKEYLSYLESKQSKGQLDFTLMNFLQKMIFGLCLFIYAFVLSKGKRNMPVLALTFFIILSLIINAWLCGTFSGVYPRYQSRVVWLMPLPIFLFALNPRNLRTVLFNGRLSSIRPNKNNTSQINENKKTN